MAIELYPHQIKALHDLRNGYILKGGVGTGKSRTALAYYVNKVCGAELTINGIGDDAPPRHPRDLVIITTAKKRESLEWTGELSDFGLSLKENELFGDVHITVDSWNNIRHYVTEVNSFFIFDEQRVVGSGQWSKDFITITRKNQWILLSATPGDVWKDYIPVFVAHGFYANRTEFTRQHIVFKPFAKFPQIDRYVETDRLERLRRKISIDMPYARHTVRHPETIAVDFNEKLFDRVKKDRWHIYEDRPLKDVGEMFVVMRKLVNTDVSRLGAVMGLFELYPKLIIFYNFTVELEMLRQLKDILGVEVREWNGQKHENVPAGNEWIYLVQYSAGAEGWNCITTDTVVFWSLSYSYRLTEQAKGRIDRLNTTYTDLNYFYLRSSSMIDSAIWRALSKKEEFNERSFKFV